MKIRLLLMFASLSSLIAGCASDPTFNVMPPPIYQSGSIKGPEHRGIAAAVPSSAPKLDRVETVGNDLSSSAAPVDN